MPAALPPGCLRLLESQDGVITVSQAVSAGLPARAVRDLVRGRRWQVLHRGVYTAFTGPVPRGAELWGVILRAGPESVLSHETAAELWGLLSPPAPVIHVTVPHDSNPERRGAIRGVIVHRSRAFPRAAHPVLLPPRTRVEETVLDLIDRARSFDEATPGSAGPSGADGLPSRASRRHWRPGRGFSAGRRSNSLSAMPRGACSRSLSSATYEGSNAHTACRPRPGRPGFGRRAVTGTWTTCIRSTELASRSTGRPPIRPTSSGGIRTAIAGTPSTKGSPRSGSGCQT
jgi:hypothetical protein